MPNTQIKYLEDKYEFSVHEATLEWQKRGLSFTATGYGSKIPTRNMVFIPKKKRCYRIYATCYSNVASFWIIVDKERYFLKYNNFTSS